MYIDNRGLRLAHCGEYFSRSLLCLSTYRLYFSQTWAHVALHRSSKSPSLLLNTRLYLFSDLLLSPLPGENCEPDHHSQQGKRGRSQPDLHPKRLS